MSRRWTLRLVACALGASAVLAGCSAGNQEARETLPSPSSAAPSEEELPPLGPEDFPMPAQARERTPEGAVEFTRYYVALAQFLAKQSRDPAPLSQLSESCSICDRIARSLQEDRDAGYKYTAYEYSFRSNGPGLMMGDQAEVGFVYNQGPITVVDSAGLPVASRSTGVTGDLQSGAALKWRDELQAWVITTLTVG